MPTAAIPTELATKPASPIRGLLIAMAVSAGLWGAIGYGAYALRLILIS